MSDSFAWASFTPQLLSRALTCTGSAVAGVWEPDDAAVGKGRWRVKLLSEDQTGCNSAEAARWMRSEHPVSEADDIIRNGRVLGDLEPTPSPAPSSQATIARYARIECAPTPPYVTACPVVNHRVLNLPTADGAGQAHITLRRARHRRAAGRTEVFTASKHMLSPHRPARKISCACVDGQRQRPLRPEWVFVDLSAMARTRRASTLSNDNPNVYWPNTGRDLFGPNSVVLDYEGQRTYGRRNCHLQDKSGSEMQGIERRSSVKGTHTMGTNSAEPNMLGKRVNILE
ncbi:hypothetical protein B0H19DRAFT_1083857 [Mycena capillaripes]|nr:hypothetical protein B0H19DRAFT_1083857 [Mycena capillaripes]